MSALLDTPLQQLGRLIEDVEQRHDSYDVDGTQKGVFQEKHEQRLQDTLHGARMAFYRVACDLRAETAADLVVQLHSAFVILDCQAGSKPDESTDADLHRARTAIASALSVVLRSVDDPAAIPLRSDAAHDVNLLFDRRPRVTEAPA